MIKIGSILDNQELTSLFKCGNSGGMRRSKKTNSLVLVCDHTKMLYKDEWKGNILHYTGMGKIGDQDIDYRQNKTLKESRINGIDVHLFEVHEAKKYQYKGKVHLAGEPYQSYQNDENGDKRIVWVFPYKNYLRNFLYNRIRGVNGFVDIHQGS